MFVVPLPIFDSDTTSATGEAEGGGESGGEIPAPALPEDLRWRGTPLRMGDWAAWFESQLKLSTKVWVPRGINISVRIKLRERA